MLMKSSENINARALAIPMLMKTSVLDAREFTDLVPGTGIYAVHVATGFTLVVFEDFSWFLRFFRGF